jgi:hypothetical protein
MDIKTSYKNMTAEEREKLARDAEISMGMLTQVAYGHKQIELGFADVLVAKSGGKFDLDGVPLTERAKKQRKLREAPTEQIEQGA